MVCGMVCSRVCGMVCSMVVVWSRGMVCSMVVVWSLVWESYNLIFGNKIGLHSIVGRW